MSPELLSYLKENKWKQFYDGWDLTLNSECYATINIRDGVFIYSKDCPDVKMPIEDFFPDLFFDSEEKLIEFLEKSVDKPHLSHYNSRGHISEGDESLKCDRT